MFLHVSSRFILNKNLFSAVCEAVSLVQIKVSFVFILLDRTDFLCLSSALVCDSLSANTTVTSSSSPLRTFRQAVPSGEEKLVMWIFSVYPLRKVHYSQRRDRGNMNSNLTT